MSNVHFEPVVYVVRFYSDGRSYENRDRYDGVGTLKRTGEYAMLSGLHGRIRREHYEALARRLFAIGVRKLIAERHGKVTIYTPDDVGRLQLEGHDNDERQ